VVNSTVNLRKENDIDIGVEVTSMDELKSTIEGMDEVKVKSPIISKRGVNMDLIEGTSKT